MQVHRNIDELPSFRNAVITIGTFDGVHMGHRQIIDKLKTEAKEINGETVIITFHPHPRKVVSSAFLGIRLINTLDEKLSLMEQLGIDHVVVVPFTDTFANQSAGEYLKNFLIDRFHPHTIIIGYDHHFGRERKGNYLLMEKLAGVYDYVLKEIPQHILDEIAISSTKIREALLAGKIEVADKLLGYNYFFSGIVVDGNKMGRKMGYPTANLRILDEEKIVPGDGIYAVYAQIEGQDHHIPEPVFGDNPRPDIRASENASVSKPGSDDPGLLKGMMSIGFRPTVDGKHRVIEVNLFDFDKEIYGQSLRVYTKKYLREELKFDSIAELVKQIDQDKVESLKVL